MYPISPSTPFSGCAEDAFSARRTEDTAQTPPRRLPQPFPDAWPCALEEALLKVGSPKMQNVRDGADGLDRLRGSTTELIGLAEQVGLGETGANVAFASVDMQREHDDFESVLQNREMHEEARSLEAISVLLSAPHVSYSPTATVATPPVPMNYPSSYHPEMEASASSTKYSESIHNDESLPAPGGALFKCAICGDMVYETQLDHHVNICPENASPLGNEPDEPCQDQHQDEGRNYQTGYSNEGLNYQPADEYINMSPEYSAHESVSSRGTPLAKAARPKSADGTAGGRRRDSASMATTPRSSVRVRSASSLSRECASQLAPDTGAASNSNSQPRRVWRQYSGSNIQVHQAESEQRTQQKQQMLQAQLHRREVEQCTFTPRLLNRRSGSRGTTGRHVSLSASGEDEWLRSQLAARQRKVERVEAEVYADVTHRPQISPFAQAWAKGEKEVVDSSGDRDGRSKETVFERLYKIAVQERTALEAREQKVIRGLNAATGTAKSGGDSFSDVGNSNHAGGGQPSKSAAQGVPRKDKTSQLLYIDALDRRQRQRCSQEQAHEFEELERRNACQVLGRSRRYYWQMLERQIKVAFDTAAEGMEMLTCPALEIFLRYFGVLRAPKSQTPAVVDRAAEESRKLRAALWRHLDPDKNGCVDFLTLTVFFHVLMGAVDEEAQCLHNLSNPLPGSLNASAEEPSIAEAAAAAAGIVPTPLDSPGGTTGVLAAISEESGFAGETGSDEEITCGNTDGGAGGVGDAASAAAAAAAAADPEGRRICELLMRFDPKKLRGEFQQLYLDRMHNWRAVVPPPEQPSLAPEINDQSRVMAGRVAQRQRDESGGVAESHMDLMRWRHSQTEAKKSEMRSRREVEEVKQCTFQPSIKSRPRSTSPVPDQGRGYNRLYNDSSTRQKDREKKATALESHRSNHELEQCTFAPDLKKSVKSFTRVSVGGSPPPRGYDLSTQRMRRAFATQAPRRRFLEDRFQATSPGRGTNDDRQRLQEQPRQQAVKSPRQAPQQPRQKSPAPKGIKMADAPAQFVESSTRGKPQPLDGGNRTPPLSSPQRNASVTNRMHAGTHLASNMDTQAHLQPFQPSQPSQFSHFEQDRLSQSDNYTVAHTHQFEHSSEIPISSHSHFMMVAPPNGAQHMETHPSRSAPIAPPTPRHEIETENFETHDWKQGGASSQGAPAPSAGPRVQRPSQGSGTGRNNPSARTRYEEQPDDPIPTQEARSTTRADQPPSMKPPLVYVEVNIAAGRPPEKLVLVEGQRPADAAAQFAARHNLPPALAERLDGLLQQLLANKPKAMPGTAPVGGGCNSAAERPMPGLAQ